MKWILRIGALVLVLFALTGCQGKAQDLLLTEEVLIKNGPLPTYRVSLGEEYLRLERENPQTPFVIPLQLLRMAFPALPGDFPADAGAPGEGTGRQGEGAESGAPSRTYYVGTEGLKKIPGLTVTEKENTLEIYSRVAQGSHKGPWAWVSLREPFSGQGHVFLVNRAHSLTEEFMDTALVELANGKVQTMQQGMRIAEEAGRQLELLGETFYQETGRRLVVVSVYRDYQHQDRIFKNRIAQHRMNLGLTYEEAYEKASQVVAIPGTSEHQSGRAVDFSTLELLQAGRALVSDFSQTLEGRWLADNAYRFGYILRYPNEKSKVTGIIFEPWHYRYVGQPHAAIMQARGDTLEEYLEEIRLTGMLETGNHRLWYLDPVRHLVSQLQLPATMKAEQDNKGGWIISQNFMTPVAPEAMK